MSTDAQPASPKYRILRELGARSQRSFAAIREPRELVVLHRFVRKGSPSTGVVLVSTEQVAMLLRDAQSLATNWHPNIARIRHVDPVNGDLGIATELVDGATLGDLLAIAAGRKTPFPLDVLVRVLLDVLAGVHGIHALRDGRGLPLGIVHGELGPANVVVGKDGIARVVNALRPRPLLVVPGSESVGYAAPETLDGGSLDARVDVYAVGVMLWEVLTGQRLHDEKDPMRVLARQREIDIPRPVLPAGSPYAPLADIAMRALSFEPSLRFRTALEMATAMRKLPGSLIASGSVVAARVNELDGERIRGRRVALDPASSGSRRRPSSQSIEAARVAVPAPPRRLGTSEVSAESSASVAPRSERATLPPASAAPSSEAPAVVEDIAPVSAEPVSLELVEEVPTPPKPAPRPPPAVAAPPAKPVPKPALPIQRKVASPRSPVAPPPVEKLPAGAAAPIVEPPPPAKPESAPVVAAAAIVAPSALFAPPTSSAPLVIEVPEAPVPPVKMEIPLPVQLSRTTESVVVEEVLAVRQEQLPGRSSGEVSSTLDLATPIDEADVTSEKPRRRGLLLLVAAVLLLLVGAVVVSVRTKSDRVEAAHSPAPPQTAVLPTAAATAAPPIVTPATVSTESAPATTSTTTSSAANAPPARAAGASPISTPAPPMQDPAKRAPRPQPTRRYEPLGI
ncbi:MAG: hypothetical protein K0S65_2789 [Labilithrix sp.]|nr:hypothetical protein [Labilithrix sp.]